MRFESFRIGDLVEIRVDRARIYGLVVRKPSPTQLVLLVYEQVVELEEGHLPDMVSVKLAQKTRQKVSNGT